MGDRGEKSQSSANFLDQKTGILFYTQVQKDGIACWNTKKPFTLENLPLCANDNETLVFPNDLKVRIFLDAELFVLSELFNFKPFLISRLMVRVIFGSYQIVCLFTYTVN